MCVERRRSKCTAAAHELGHSPCGWASARCKVSVDATQRPQHFSSVIAADVRSAIPGHAHGISSLSPLYVQDAQEEEQLVWPGGERPHNPPPPAAHLRACSAHDAGAQLRVRTQRCAAAVCRVYWLTSCPVLFLADHRHWLR